MITKNMSGIEKMREIENSHVALPYLHIFTKARGGKEHFIVPHLEKMYKCMEL